VVLVPVPGVGEDDHVPLLVEIKIKVD